MNEVPQAMAVTLLGDTEICSLVKMMLLPVLRVVEWVLGISHPQ